MRGRLRAALAGGGLPAGADGGERLLLAVEELTSNGLRHGRPPVRVAISATGLGWLLEVTDTATAQPPVPAVGRDAALGGMGLGLVARISRAHGWSLDGDHKTVWAHIAYRTSPDPPPARRIHAATARALMGCLAVTVDKIAATLRRRSGALRSSLTALLIAGNAPAGALTLRDTNRQRRARRGGEHRRRPAGRVPATDPTYSSAGHPPPLLVDARAGRTWLGGARPDVTVELSDWSMSTRKQTRVAAALTPLLESLFGAETDAVNVRFHSYPPTDSAVGGRLLSARIPRVARLAKRVLG